MILFRLKNFVIEGGIHYVEKMESEHLSRSTPSVCNEDSTI